MAKLTKATRLATRGVYVIDGNRFLVAPEQKLAQTRILAAHASLVGFEQRVAARHAFGRIASAGEVARVLVTSIVAKNVDVLTRLRKVDLAGSIVAAAQGTRDYVVGVVFFGFVDFLGALRPRRETVAKTGGRLAAACVDAFLRRFAVFVTRQIVAADMGTRRKPG